MNSPFVIIGAGPAGLACARRLVMAGLRVVVMDDNAQPGGQYFRQLPRGYRLAPGHGIAREQNRAEALFPVLSHPLVTYMPDCTVWAMAPPLTLAYAKPTQSGRIEASAIVVAAGAFDRPMPFPGWTLPGVITAGGCLNLIKGQGMIPGGRVAVVGNGPLLLVVTYSLLKAGAKVTVVVEAVQRSAIWRHLRGLRRSPKLLLKGLKYQAALVRSRVPFLDGHVVVEAEGKDAVSGVIVAPVDGQTVPNRRRSFAVDAIVTGYGLAPSNELTRMFGCHHVFDSSRGGWIPERSADLETSLPGVFAVGDCAGIGGVEIALLEGEIAGEALAVRFGKRPSTSRTKTSLQRLNQFRDALNRFYLPVTPLWLGTPTTTICRCEELSMAEVQEAARNSRSNLRTLKAITRLSMGRCQGRNCLRSAAILQSLESGVALDELPLPRSRWPARPVPIAQLLDEPLGPVMPDQMEKDTSIEG